ncbi:hypothetical protein RUND412_005112 [Rhizina undulata]
MSSSASTRSPTTSNEIHKTIWNDNAVYWDEAIGASGNSFYRHLVAPAAERLLDVKPDENILELACGNGIFARKLCQLGASVMATDFSPKMIELAKGRTSEEELQRIHYMNLDMTKEVDLDGLVALSLKHLGFDAIVCNMALMDVSTIEHLAAAVPRLLKGKGRFVATVMHPAFNSSGTSRHIQVGEDPITGRIGKLYSINVSRYLNIPPTKGEAIPGQSKSQYYFHRPLHEILSTFFKHGLVMDGIEEPAFSPHHARNHKKELSWQNYSQIPSIMAFRLCRGDANSE